MIIHTINLDPNVEDFLHRYNFSDWYRNFAQISLKHDGVNSTFYISMPINEQHEGELRNSSNRKRSLITKRNNSECFPNFLKP